MDHTENKKRKRRPKTADAKKRYRNRVRKRKRTSKKFTSTGKFTTLHKQLTLIVNSFGKVNLYEWNSGNCTGMVNKIKIIELPEAIFGIICLQSPLLAIIASQTEEFEHDNQDDSNNQDEQQDEEASYTPSPPTPPSPPVQRRVVIGYHTKCSLQGLCAILASACCNNIFLTILNTE